MKRLMQTFMAFCAAAFIFSILQICDHVLTKPLKAATYIDDPIKLTLSAVDGTPLTGKNADRTFMASDRVADYCVLMKEQWDIVEITLYCTTAQSGADGDTALLNIYGYNRGGPTIPIYDACTFTLGLAVSTGTGVYAESADGTDAHTFQVLETNSGTDTIVQVSFDKKGFEGLYIEPETFTGVTGVTVIVNGYGMGAAQRQMSF